MKILELFAGSRSFGKVGEELGFKVFSSDIMEYDNIDYISDILDFHPKNIPFVPDIIWASPPCTFFSVASIGKHWYKNHTPKTSQAILGMQIVMRTLDIIKYFIDKNPNLKYYIENPRGKLRKLKIMEGIPRTTIWYCKYGDNRAKPTDIWSNNLNNMFNINGWTPRSECFNGNENCHHQVAPRGSKTGTQGIKGSYDRSKLPYELCNEILINYKKLQNCKKVPNF
jgi:hypothetical protein